MPQVASCMFMCLPALSCTVVHRERGKEGGKRGEGGGKEEKKIRPPGPPREGLLEEFEINPLRAAVPNWTLGLYPEVV